MSQTTGPWSVKGIDARAREAARERARQEGMTLGEYLNSLILKGGEVGAQDIVAPISAPTQQRQPQAGASSLNKLVSRIEAAEARSTLAITGIDQSVVGLLKRLEDTETEHIAMARHVDGVIDDIRSTYEALRDKVRRIEEDDSAEQNLEALKALENALGKLASHVYEESALAQNETDAIKGRVESGFSDVNERLESMDTKVERTLTDAARRVEKAVEQAELRAEGTARHLSERMSTLDSKISRHERSEEEQNKRIASAESQIGALSDKEENLGERLSDAEKRLGRQEAASEDLDGRVQEAEARIGTTETAIEDTGTRVDAIEEDVTTALESMEATLLRVQDRLNRAETTTDAALKSLESTFDILDQRIGEVAKAAPEHANELRAQFEKRFDGLADDLRASIAATRAELAIEIEKAAHAGMNAEQVESFESKISDIQRRLSESDARNESALETVGEQVNRITDNFDKRLQDVENSEDGALATEMREEVSKLAETVHERLEILEDREASVIERVGDEMTKIADQLDERITESEQRSATAIEQVGEQVSRVATRLQSRQDEALQAFSEKLEESQVRSETRLSDALANVSERLELMQTQSSQTLSPVQKAIASLATRLDSLEEFASPPFAEAPRAAALPELRPLPINDPLFTDAIKADENEPVGTSVLEESATVVSEAPETEAASTDETEIAAATAEADAEFEPGIESWDDVRDETPAPAEEPSTYTAEVPPADLTSDDPIAELENWADSASEARDIDVFDEEFDTPEVSAQAATETEEDSKPIDFINAARAAARNAAEGVSESSARRSKSKEKKPKAPKAAQGSGSDSDGGASKLPLIATASVVAIAAAGGTAYYAMKGNEQIELQKIDTPQMPQQIASTSVSGVVPSAVEPEVVETATAVGSETTLEDELFDAVPEAPEAAPTQPVETVSAEPAAPVAVAPVQTVQRTQPVEVTPVSAERVETSPTPAPVKAAEPKPKISPIDVPVTLESAAATGDTKALYALGVSMLDNGDYAEGAALMRKSAEAGEPAAQYRLGKLHEKGLGVPRDLSAARKWTESAANGGNIRAMHDLAVFYAQGDGGPQSYAAAVNWFRKAAEFGVTDSQYNLGVLYERGIGIEPDPSEAMFWFVVAARGGDAASAAKVDEVSKLLPVENARATDARAKAWSSKPASGQANGLFPGQNWGGITKQHIAKVQSALNALGYEAGRADGSIGPDTRKAIQLFQHEHGLKSDGEVTADLIKKINEIAVS